MKKINFLWLISILMLLPTSFISCSDDDDEEVVGDFAELLGTWQLTRVDGWELCDEHGKDDLTEIVSEDEASFYDFKEDGTYREYWFDDGGWSNSGTYVFDKEAKTLTVKEKGYSAEKYEVLTLTSSKLVLVDNDDEAYIKQTLKKIK